MVFDQHDEISEVDGSAWYQALLDQGEVTSRDIDHLRADVFPLGLRSRQDAERLCEIEIALPAQGPAWTHLLVELITDFVVWGERPTGVVSKLQAYWLIDQADALPVATARTLLATIASEAQVVPAWLTAAIAFRVEPRKAVAEPPAKGATIIPLRAA